MKTGKGKVKSVRSRFIGNCYDGYEVVHVYAKKKYYYVNDNGKNLPHTAYDFVLVNYDEKKSVVLSGFCLGKIDRGERSIKDVLNPGVNVLGSKNAYINSIIKQNKICGR